MKKEESLELAQGGFWGGKPDARFRRWPQPLASAILEMLYEPPANSADELVHLLEIYLKFQGSLWLAVYLQGEESDARLERLFLSMLLEGRRDLSVGAWAYLGSQIAHTFLRKGWKKPHSLLDHFSYGDARDSTTPLSRMLQYRNRFAHGSFDALLSEILVYRRLFWGMMEGAQGWEEAPLLFWEEGQEAWCLLDLEGERWEGVIPEGVRRGEVYWRIAPDRWFALSPVFTVQREKDAALYAKHAYHLKPFSISQSSVEAREEIFSSHKSMRERLRRYKEQRAGILRFASWAEEAQGAACFAEEQIEAIRESLTMKHADAPRFVLVLAYPGAGKSRLIAEAGRLFPSFDVILRYQIARDDLTRSAVVFARYLLREMAVILDQPSLTEGLEESKGLFERLEGAWQASAQRGHRVLLCIDRFHLAYEGLGAEEKSIHELLSNWQGGWAGQIACLLAARSGYRDTLLYDAVFELPPSNSADTSTFPRLLAELGLDPEDPDTRLFPQEIALRRRLLSLLASSTRPLSVFALCDLLHKEADEGRAPWSADQRFTPHIERCLLEMLPILLSHREEAGGRVFRVYQPFCESFGAYLRESMAEEG